VARVFSRKVSGGLQTFHASLDHVDHQSPFFFVMYPARTRIVVETGVLKDLTGCDLASEQCFSKIQHPSLFFLRDVTSGMGVCAFALYEWHPAGWNTIM